LNTQQAVMLYPTICLFEGTLINLGRGTRCRLLFWGAVAEGKYDFSFTPVSIAGMSENPLYMNQVCYGLDLRHYDIDELRKKRRSTLGG